MSVRTVQVGSVFDSNGRRLGLWDLLRLHPGGAVVAAAAGSCRLTLKPLISSPSGGKSWYGQPEPAVPQRLNLLLPTAVISEQ